MEIYYIKENVGMSFNENFQRNSGDKNTIIFTEIRVNFSSYLF